MAGLASLPPTEHRIDKALVTSVLEKLGPRRVMRGHVAFAHGVQHDWRACFLALCYGGWGKMVLATDRISKPGNEAYSTGDVLGLTNHEVWAVVEAFDHCRPEFQVLVEEWLELNYALVAVHCYPVPAVHA